MSRVIVAGSINLDVVVTTPRRPRLGETVGGASLRYLPGGKGANQAVAAALAGASTAMIGAVGSDFGADLTIDFLRARGVDVGAVARRPELATGTAIVVVTGDGENAIVVAPGANATVDAESAASVEPSAGDVLVAQLEIPPATTTAFFALGRAAGARCVFNPAPFGTFDLELTSFCDLLVVNEVELSDLAGALGVAPPAVAGGRGASVPDLARAVQAAAAVDLVVTRGERGVLCVTGEGESVVEAHRVAAIDTTGAGDCFVGSLAGELASGVPLERSLAYANAAAALSVQREGAGPSMPQRVDVEALLAGLDD